jgi:hypothetical protein
VPPTFPGPTFTLELALVPSATLAWTLGTGALGSTTILGGNVGGNAPYVTIASARTFTITRGRQDELATIQPGTCSVLVDNNSGALSPEYASGPYYPYVLPLRLLRISAVWNSITYRLFTGYVQSYTPVDNTVVDADIQITAIDWLYVAQQAQLQATYPLQDDAARITAILTSLAAPNTSRSIDVGVDQVLPVVLGSPTGAATGPTAAQHIADVVAAEGGLFYVKGDGTLTYETRRTRLQQTRSQTSQATFGQTAPDLPYLLGSTYTLDDRDIRNDIRIRATGVVPAEVVSVASDPNSQAIYGVRTRAIDSAIMGPGQSQNMATAFLQRYKDPHPRFNTITVDGDASDNLWPHMLGREISDRITVKKDVPGHLSFNRDMWIEGIRMSENPETGMQVTWQLSDATPVGVTPWRLGSGQLGTSTALVW